ncbi:MAG: type II/IV secretion system ATPase subunit [Thermoprotei archaeon]
MSRDKRKVVPRVTFRLVPLVAVVQGVVVDRYSVGQASVLIVDENGKGRYIISEPEMSEEEQSIYSLLMEYLYYSLKPVATVEDPGKYVEKYIWDAASDLGIVDAVSRSFQKYKYYISRDAFGYGLINVPMNDHYIEEISCEGYDKPVAVIHRKYTEYDWLDTNIRFGSEDALRSFVQRLAQRCGKSVTVAIPFTDAMTREGHRIAVTFSGEVSLPGSSFDIRRFPEEPYTIGHIVKFGSMSPLMAAYYWLLVENKGFVMIIGPMGSGKTSMINSLATMIPPTMKVCTIEDTPELKLPHVHWERLKARHTYSITETKFDVDLMDLTKLSMRFRPDYIIVGEVRGEEIRALVQASATGHGCITSFHAENPEAAIVRMQSPPMDVALGGIMLIWNFLLMNRVRREDGKIVRRALISKELIPGINEIKLSTIFEWDARTDTFTPDDPYDVVKKSYRLTEISRLVGWSQDDVVRELEERSSFIKKIVEDNRITFSEISEAIGEFYRRRILRGHN